MPDKKEVTDWGTSIVDAGGIFHDLTKNAFDALSNSVKQPLNVTEKILKDNFSKTWQDFRQKASSEFGVSLEEGLSLERIGKSLAGAVSKHVLELGVEALGGAALSKLAGIEGPLGLIMSQVVTIGIAEFAKKFIRQSYDAGQWVILDLGMIPVRVNQAPHVIQLTETTSIWGDSFIDLPDDIDYQETPNHAVAFVMGPGDTHSEWVVFNYASGKEERFMANKIRPAPPELAAKLDKNTQFSLVREVKFLKDHDPTLKSYVPTQPGDAVIYKGNHYIIVDTFGEEYIIEHKVSGDRVHVNVSQLTGGIRENTSKWKRGNAIDNSFTSLSPDTIFVGEWVWVPAGQKFIDALTKLVSRRRMAAVPSIKPEDDILALVERVEGDQVHLVRAFDGAKITEPIDVTRGVKSEIADVLNHNKASKKYKQRVLEGRNTETHPLGESLHDLALGQGAPDVTGSDDMVALMKEVAAVWGPDSAVHDIPGDRNAMNARGKPIQDEIDEEANWDATNRYKIIVEGIPGDGPPGSSGSVMILIACGVLFLALYGK